MGWSCSAIQNDAVLNHYAKLSTKGASLKGHSLTLNTHKQACVCLKLIYCILKFAYESYAFTDNAKISQEVYCKALILTSSVLA